MEQTTTWPSPNGALTTPPSAPPPPPAPAKRPGRSWKTSQLVAISVGCLVIGGIAGGSSSGDAKKVKTAKAELVAAKAKAADDVAAADKRATDALPAAQAQVDAADAARKASLDQRSAALDARSAQLDARDVAVSAKEAAKRASTFGDGTYQIGIDIQPGTYHTDGDGQLCFAQTNGANGAILDQEVQYGSVVFTIPATAQTFKSSNCGTWTKR